MKFDIKKEQSEKAFWLCSDNYADLFQCGNSDIVIYKEDSKSESFCCQNENSHFDNRGVEKALVQNPRKDLDDPNYFTPKRIIVIQMN